MLNLKTSHKAVKDYFVALERFDCAGISHETSIRNAFQELLTYCCKRVDWNFFEEYKIDRKGQHPIWIDGAMLDAYNAPTGYWEAKDLGDDLSNEVKKKFEAGYPRDNIIFQNPARAILYQGYTPVLDEDITTPKMLVQVLHELFRYKTDTQLEWEQAVDLFKEQIPEYGEKLIGIIEKEKETNDRFVTSYQDFAALCRESVNPNLADSAIEEMLVQH